MLSNMWGSAPVHRTVVESAALGGRRAGSSRGATGATLRQRPASIGPTGAAWAWSWVGRESRRCRRSRP